MNYFRKQDEVYLSIAAADLELDDQVFKQRVIETIPFNEIRRLNLSIQDQTDLKVVSFSVMMNLSHFLRQRNVDVHFKAPRNLYSLLKKLNLNTAFASFSQAD